MAAADRAQRRPWPVGTSPPRTVAADKITSARQTREFVRRAQGVAASAEFHDMGRVGHYMFRNIPAWNAFAVDRSLAFAGVGARTPE